MHKRGSDYTDSIVVLPNISNFIEELKLLETSEIIIIDYRAYVIDTNLEEYFEKQISG